MDFTTCRDYFLSKPEAGEDFPFYPDVAVFKVKGKMFATLSIDDGLARCNLKCEPNEALMLRDVFPAVKPGYHMNKRHWNTVLLDSSIPQGEIERMIDNSYALVIRKLPRLQRQGLELKYGRHALYAELE